MERRDFVRGVLVSASAGTALVKLATPEETQALSVGKETELIQPSRYQSMPQPEDAGMLVYAKRDGKFVNIGYLGSYTIDVSHENLSWRGEIIFRGWK